MRIGAALLLLAVLSGSCGSGILKQYEYEEDMYLSLDGSATLYVNSSVAALNALRGSSFDAAPTARLDRDQLRRYFTGPFTSVTRRPSLSRRRNRRFVHVRIDVPEVRKLGGSAPFARSTYRFARDGDQFVYEQTVGAPSAGADQHANWSGDETVAFRLHLPSRIVYHNAGPVNPQRGNILVWEQPLTARVRGEPLRLEARFESQSILYRTLFLFAGTLAVVAAGFVLVVWWIVRGGPKPAQV